MDSIDEKVMDMLGMPVTLEPDSDVHYKQMVKRIATVGGYDTYEDSYGTKIYIDIKVIFQSTETDPELCDRIFTVPYPGSKNYKDVREELKRFLEDLKEKKAYIGYVPKNPNRNMILHMIAPVQTQTGLLYAKGDGRNDKLEPYVVKDQLLEVLIKEGLMVQYGNGYRLNAPVLSQF